MRIEDQMETGVLIIGGGLSGLTAAWETGAERPVALLLDGGGASPYIHGFSLPQGPGDSPDLLLEDTCRSGRFQNDPALAEKLAGGSLTVPDLLRRLGVSLDREADGSLSLLHPLGASVPRVASAGNHTGAVLMGRLRERLAARGNVHFCGGYRALRLFTDSAGVTGALAYDRTQNRFVRIRAEAVVLACGGFCGIFPFSTNTADIGGDGIAMAYLAGAAVRDLEFIQFEPCVGLSPAGVRGKGMITTLFYEGACLRNRAGERFLAASPERERLDKDVLSWKIFREIDKGNGTAGGGVWFDAAAVGRERLKEAYPAYLERYAAYGIDLAAEPVEVAPAPHTSLGGVAISADCSTTLPGLFACGEVAGGVHGANRLGGNAGLETMVFGMTAGRSAGRYSRKEAGILREDFHLPFLPAEARDKIRRRMERELSKNLGVIRQETGLCHALLVLEELLGQFSPSGDGGPLEYYETLRLQNDLQTAFLLARAALARRESCGCHIRQDH